MVLRLARCNGHSSISWRSGGRHACRTPNVDDSRLLSELSELSGGVGALTWTVLPIAETGSGRKDSALYCSQDGRGHRRAWTLKRCPCEPELARRPECRKSRRSRVVGAVRKFTHYA